MASPVAVSLPGPRDRHEHVVRAALDVFAHVEQVCSRFVPTSPLSRCNARPGEWHRCPPTLARAVSEARLAYEETAGAFDPRVHDRLVQLGYGRSFLTGPAEAQAPPPPPAREGARRTWRPRTLRRLRLVNLAGERIDLGGIGKGLALRWAAGILRRAATDFLVEAGGDLVACGTPGSGGWRVGVEDPHGADGPVAVLDVSGRAVATSSVRIRQWSAGGRRVHHLIDPRTGEPGGDGLLSATVVAEDPAWAEVWSKALFLAGARGIADLAADRRLAALWVGGEGVLGVSGAMAPYLLWVRP